MAPAPYNVGYGDELYALETPDGIRLTTYAPDFAAKMEVAEPIMRERRGLLRKLADLAASLAFGLARKHPFVDGNKRTAAVACEVFLALNGATCGRMMPNCIRCTSHWPKARWTNPSSPTGCVRTCACRGAMRRTRRPRADRHPGRCAPGRALRCWHPPAPPRAARRPPRPQRRVRCAGNPRPG